MSIAGIVLAAGRSTRMGSNKLLATYRDRPLVVHAIAAALASPLQSVVVVTGHQAATVAAAIAAAMAGGDLPDAADRLRVVHNPRFADGLAASLQAGLAALGGDVDGAMVMLGDMPLVTPALVARLLAAHAAHPEAAAIAPLIEGRRGNPVLMMRPLFPALATLVGDEGARRLLAGRADVVDVEIADPGAALDIDTPDALRDLLATQRT
ncbi:nucleotidyltransferase family protein [Chelatococcus reniformis]|uniref:MobA-like NTP transferase domain-containing protein n=1 Tax=Chelatococcus reniformis TaxID=1494448 RepID=A0A916XMP6_9HYPH|nr:nucleotidyltransferase family protein [Chelatococcus reniformis]GGC84848.1 hypothetical protein GCM10010994_48420 [Chelatococcus reniformis]